MRAQRDLREQLLEQAKSFLDELQRSRKELFAILQQELGIVEGELTEQLREPETYGGTRPAVARRHRVQSGNEGSGSRRTSALGHRPRTRAARWARGAADAEFDTDRIRAA